MLLPKLAGSDPDWHISCSTKGDKFPALTAADVALSARKRAVIDGL